MSRAVHPDGQPEHVMFWCPGCDGPHCVPTVKSAHQAGLWYWNGSLDRPTLEPSLLTRYGGETTLVCHLFVRDGKIEYLSDCTHRLAGQTIDVPDWDSV